MAKKRVKANKIHHWTKRRVQICTTEKWRVCASCDRKRMLKFYLTSSKNLTKVCDECRDQHDENVAMKNVSTTINSPGMDTDSWCEKCGLPMKIREIAFHRKGCITGKLYDIPGIKPPGVLAE